MPTCQWRKNANNFSSTNLTREVRGLPFVNWESTLRRPIIRADQRTIEIPLSTFLIFEKGCPGKLTCAKELSDDQQERLRQLAGLFSIEFGAAHKILLRGQADREKGSDDFVNFRLGNERALAVYKVFFRCASACGLDGATGSLRKVQLANVGDTLAAVSETSELDRTVTIILDYSAQ
ncbi:MAG: hypothetical protein JWQ49_2990 [Edaphobacter sp.]|nr:hypothetical protein [Edaphobacter sp.]